MLPYVLRGGESDLKNKKIEVRTVYFFDILQYSVISIMCYVCVFETLNGEQRPFQMQLLYCISQ